MELVSTFELLVKRIAPLSGNSTIDAPFRRVVQGYFLTIANPSNRTVRLRVRAIIPTWVGSPPSPDPLVARELVSGTPATRNHIYTYDITGGVNNGQVVYDNMIGPSIQCNENQTISSRIFSTQTLRLPPCQTASVKILPDLGSPVINLPNPRLEIRGYIEIFQPFIFHSRRPAPVDLILTPEIRGTFLDNNYPDFCGGKQLDFDYIAYSLPLASGAALVNVDALNVPFFLDLFSTQVQPQELEIKRDFSGKYILQDDTLRYFDDLINREKEINPRFNFNLQSFREYVEFELNNNYNLEEEEPPGVNTTDIAKPKK